MKASNQIRCYKASQPSQEHINKMLEKAITVKRTEVSRSIHHYNNLTQY